MRRCLLVMTVAWGLSMPAAAAVWDFYGGAGIDAGRSDNPRFRTSGARLRSVCDATSSNHDPNDPLCDPNSPTFDPFRSAARSSRRSDVTGALRATGGLAGAWSATTFDISYSPTASWYATNSGLGEISHYLRAAWRHEYSPRLRLNLTNAASYSPEQDIDDIAVQRNSVLVERTARTTNNFNGNLDLQSSPKTTYSWTARYHERAFSSDAYVDSSDQQVGMQWRRLMGRNLFVSAGYQYGLFSFKKQFSGSEHHSASVGLGFDRGRGFNIGVTGGYNVLLPDNHNADRSTGSAYGGTVGLTFPKLNLAGGYNHGFSDGGGAFVTAETDHSFANLRWAISRTWTANLSAAYQSNTRLQTSGVTTGPDETIRTFNGRSSVAWTIAQNWSINASYSHYRQGVPSGVGAASRLPDLRVNRYSAGIAWSVR